LLLEADRGVERPTIDVRMQAGVALGRHLIEAGVILLLMAEVTPIR
jgi:hypothetical protein